MMAQLNVAPVIIKRKKGGGGDGHHGGAWKVAYADFVTAMMAFFLLMWLLNATTDKQRKGLADYFSPSIPMHSVSSGSDGPFGGDSVFSQDSLLSDGTGATDAHATERRQSAGATGVDSQAQQEAENEAFKDIEEALNGKGGESLVTDEALKHIVTRVTDEGLIIELFDIDGTPLFNEGTDQPSDLLRDLLRMIARVSANIDNGVAVAGHVRANAIVQSKNPVWELSSARAARAHGLLEAGGLRPERVRRVTGYADRKPAVSNTMAPRNNRIEVTLLRKGKE
ncbi:MAG: chemotaxis protein MotB [Pseudooceanicola sp.]|nr:chemotaxis protein MotB [Pseudooceanicola sp.]